MSDDQTPDEPTSGEAPPPPPAAEDTPTTPSEAPSEAVAPLGSSEPPTVAATETAEPTETAAVTAAADSPAEVAAPHESWWDAPRIIVVGLLVLALGIGGGFLLGRSTADSGPSSLADAVNQTAKGDMPVGDLSLQQVLGALGERGGNGSGGVSGLLGGLLGGKNGDTNGLLNGLLNQLRDRLGQEYGGNQSGGSGSNGGGSIGGGSGGSGSGGTGSTTSQAFLGISAAAAPTGQSGVQVAGVAAASPAAEAGLRAGDVITAVDGTAVTTPAALVTAIHAHNPGDQVTITYTRDGKSADVKVQLGKSATATTQPATPTTPPTTGRA